MKFRGHETFFVRKGWLSKGMKYIEKTQGKVFINKEENPMDVLGIGSNMVKSLRYWLQAVGLTEEKVKQGQFFTSLGNLVFKNDRYLEEIGTLQLLHYKLASNKDLATSWYFFFNNFSIQEFSQEDFITDLQKYIKSHGETDEKASVSNRSLSDDFSCLLGTYLPRTYWSANDGKLSAENNITCPFAELNLLSSLRRTSDKARSLFKKAMPAPSSFEPSIVLAIIADTAEGRGEIKLNELLTRECSLGKIFNLDTITLIEVLRLCEKDEKLKIIRTAGLDLIRLSNPEKSFEDYVTAFYDSIRKSEVK